MCLAGSIGVSQDSGVPGPSVEHKKECDGNFDLNTALEWNNGVASLPGSTLKVKGCVMDGVCGGFEQAPNGSTSKRS